MRPRIATPRPGRRSASAARPAMGKARGMSPGRAPAQLVAVRQRDDKSEGLAVRFDERAGTVWRTDPQTARPRRNLPPALLRKEVETCGLCHARRASFQKIGCPAAGCRTPMRSHRSRAGSITPTGRCRTRSIITARSSRARCSPPASPAATVTTRTAAS